MPLLVVGFGVGVDFGIVAPGIGLRTGNDTRDIGIFASGRGRLRCLALLRFGTALLLLLLTLLTRPLPGSLVLRGSRLVHDMMIARLGANFEL